jgi:hypothetical protein
MYTQGGVFPEWVCTDLGIITPPKQHEYNQVVDRQKDSALARPILCFGL